MRLMSCWRRLEESLEPLLPPLDGAGRRAGEGAHRAPSRELPDGSPPAGHRGARHDPDCPGAGPDGERGEDPPSSCEAGPAEPPGPGDAEGARMNGKMLTCKELIEFLWRYLDDEL